jgi:hypothetical protein
MTAKMKRREFITLLGGACAWPMTARAQQAEWMRRVGMITGVLETDSEGQAHFAAFRWSIWMLCQRSRWIVVAFPDHSVLAQIGLLGPSKLPLTRAPQAEALVEKSSRKRA